MSTKLHYSPDKNWAQCNQIFSTECFYILWIVIDLQTREERFRVSPQYSKRFRDFLYKVYNFKDNYIVFITPQTLINALHSHISDMDNG